MNVTIGHDAELFLRDENGQHVPAIGLIGGTKKHPRPVKGGALQEDNVMAEINIIPATTADEFVMHTKDVLESLKNILPDGYTFDISPSVVFPDDQLTHPKSLESGCEPDLDVWKGIENPTINLSDNRRYGAGHIHIGMEDIDHHPLRRENIVRWCDIMLGAPAQLYDRDVHRRKTYGTAGRYRNKSYGIEYRTLSNFWMQTEAGMRWAFNNALRAANYTKYTTAFPYGECEMRAAVFGDEDLAAELIKAYNIALPDD